METSEPLQIWIPYVISNVVGILFLFIAIKRPKIARLLFLLLFGWASWFNYSTCHSEPEAYMMFSEEAIGFYKNFINSWFRDHITGFITIIAIGQGLIALGMLLKGSWVRFACVGIILFLLGIAPLGVYSAFPFSLTVSAAAWFVLKKDDLNYLWKFRSTEG